MNEELNDAHVKIIVKQQFLLLNQRHILNNGDKMCKRYNV